MQQENQEQISEEVEQGIERIRLYPEQQQERAQEQRNLEIARSVEQMGLRLEQQQREEANAAEVQQQPPAVPLPNPQGSTVEEAFIYLDEVMATYINRPHIYEQFLDAMTEFRCRALDRPGILARIRQLFKGNPRLIDGFNKFLPQD